jgi:quinohemoprotein ethanol dehydrogenase
MLFAKYCFYCHGVGAVSNSAVPDLRYASAGTHRQFASIVLGGVRREAGMPSFGDTLRMEQVRMIEAYVLSRAAAGAGLRDGLR